MEDIHVSMQKYIRTWCLVYGSSLSFCIFCMLDFTKVCEFENIPIVCGYIHVLKKKWRLCVGIKSLWVYAGFEEETNWLLNFEIRNHALEPKEPRFWMTSDIWHLTFWSFDICHLTFYICFAFVISTCLTLLAFDVLCVWHFLTFDIWHLTFLTFRKHVFTN